MTTTANKTSAKKLTTKAIEKKIKIANKYGLEKKDLMELLRTAYLSRKVDQIGQHYLSNFVNQYTYENMAGKRCVFVVRFPGHWVRKSESEAGDVLLDS